MKQSKQDAEPEFMLPSQIHTQFRRFDKLIEGNEARKGNTWLIYLLGEGLNLAPNEVQSFLHLLEGSEQLR